MKKLCLVLALILIFCSCGKEPEPVVPPEEPESNVSENEVNLSLLGMIGETGIYEKTIEKDEKRDGISLGTEGKLNCLSRVPAVEHWVTDKDGNLLIDHPFYEVILLHSDSIRGAAYEDAYAVMGHYEGNYYRYYFIDGEFVRETYVEGGEYTLDIPGWDNEPFSYKRTRYCYSPYGQSYEGLNDSEGKVIFEPVHNGIGIPFADRFLLGSGTGDGSAAEEKVFTLVDAKGKIYVQFNIIRFTVFDDGVYIGIAWSAGNPEGPNACYDEKGNLREKGFWFIDKDGNILSERFERIEYGWDEEIASPDDIVIAFDENGNKVEFEAEKYAVDTKISYLGTAGETKIYQKIVETGNTRTDIVYGKDGAFNSLAEVPEIEYWITDAAGNPLIEHPFYDMIFWEGIASSSNESEKYPQVRGCYKGDWCRYYFKEDKFELDVADKAGEFYSSPFEELEHSRNYVPTQYSYGLYKIFFGLNDKNGNVIFEPIFTYVPSIPFKDRIIVTTNNVDRMDGWESFSVMMDTDKNIISTFSSFYFHHFDDGSYIGIAWYAGYGEKWGHVLKDESGNILETGHRFIDKDGNVLSPCFDLFSLCGNEDDFISEYLDKTAVFTDENGKETKITPKDYICKP